MRFLILFFSSFIFFASCKDKNNNTTKPLKQTKAQAENIKYAKGFTVTTYSTHKEIIVTSAWPSSTESFRDLLVKKGNVIPEHSDNDIIIKTPVERLVTMSTTNIPALEYLNIDDKLIEFPNTDYISSEKTRLRFESGEIKNLNNDLALSMELFIDLQPEFVIVFSVIGTNKV